MAQGKFRGLDDIFGGSVIFCKEFFFQEVCYHADGIFACFIRDRGNCPVHFVEHQGQGLNTFIVSMRFSKFQKGLIFFCPLAVNHRIGKCFHVLTTKKRIILLDLFPFLILWFLAMMKNDKGRLCMFFQLSCLCLNFLSSPISLDFCQSARMYCPGFSKCFWNSPEWSPSSLFSVFCQTSLSAWMLESCHLVCRCCCNRSFLFFSCLLFRSWFLF